VVLGTPAPCGTSSSALWRDRLFSPYIRAVSGKRRRGQLMTPAEFDADLRREGYQVMNMSLAPYHLNPDHTHEFDARIMVLAVEITITRDGRARTYRPGDYWLTPAHAVHAELAGPEGVALIIGRRAGT
jgi:quercetin dioxygenase-like cupin family protein